MLDFNSASAILRKSREDLHQRFGVSKVGIFGSVARNEQTDASDIDILVDLEKPISLLKFAGLMNVLSESLGLRVDLADDADLRPELAERIRREVRFIDER